MSATEVGRLMGELSKVRGQNAEIKKEMDRRFHAIDQNMERFGEQFVEFCHDHKRSLSDLDTAQRKLVSAQKIDDDERAEREAKRKVWALVGKIVGGVLTIIVLPIAGWGGKWLADDYSQQRQENGQHSHELLLLKAHDDLADEDAHMLEDRVAEHEQRIHVIGGRLQNIEVGQRDILSAIQDNSTGRRRR